jgi:hypothetical protein
VGKLIPKRLLSDDSVRISSQLLYSDNLRLGDFIGRKIAISETIIDEKCSFELIQLRLSLLFVFLGLKDFFVNLLFVGEFFSHLHDCIEIGKFGVLLELHLHLIVLVCLIIDIL